VSWPCGSLDSTPQPKLGAQVRTARSLPEILVRDRALVDGGQRHVSGTATLTPPNKHDKKSAISHYKATGYGPSSLQTATPPGEGGKRDWLFVVIITHVVTLVAD